MIMAAAVVNKKQSNVLICAGRILPQLQKTAASSYLRVITLAFVTSVFMNIAIDN